MSSGSENWLFKVKEMSGGDLCLSPEPKTSLQTVSAGRSRATVLDRWQIQFVLPTGTDFDDARRIAELLNEWVREVTCTARPPGA